MANAVRGRAERGGGRPRQTSPAVRRWNIPLLLLVLVADLPRLAGSLRGVVAAAAAASEVQKTEAKTATDGATDENAATGAAADDFRKKLENAKGKVWGGGGNGNGNGAAMKKKVAAEAKAKAAAANNEERRARPPRGGNGESGRYTSGKVEAWEKARVDMSGLGLGDASPEDAARMVTERMSAGIVDRMAKMFERATTAECRALIGEHFGYFVNALGLEVSVPYGEEQFFSECDEEKVDFDDLPKDVSIGDIQNRTYQPPRDEAEYLENPEDLKLLYAILTHDNPHATIRLIEALHEDGYIFVVHVDGKEISDPTYDALVAYASSRDHVHVLAHPHRVRVNWGGFSMVNATLQILHYAFALDGSSNDAGPLDFHKFVHTASTSYPIRSNSEIRRRIASYPLDANMLNVVFKPNRPGPGAWNYFVECDDALHRIYRLTPLAEEDYGIDIYTSSQWFIISREFAEYIALAKPGTLVRDFLEYVEHVVVADETFFGTTLRHSPFCGKHHNDNFLHLQFDRWENELDTAERDPKKCIMPDPDHCGRSPTTMTLDYLPSLELSGSLFARKFLDDVDSVVKDVLDMKRAREEALFQNRTDGGPVTMGPDTSFEGHGVLIVARETVNNTTPLCLGLGESRNKVRLVPCFHDWVISTLAPEWETGAVIEQETLMHNRWDLGPCSSDGDLERLEDGELKMTPGRFSETGPSCLLKQRDGLRAGRCLDSESDRLQPGGRVHVYPCVKRWNQFFSFGNGAPTPQGSIHTNVPKHIKKRIESRGKTQEPFLCLGVMGRGEIKDDEWEEDEGKERVKDDADLLPNATDEYSGATNKLPLHHWSGKQLIATPCSNVDAVVKWVYIPFIVEDDHDEGADDDAIVAESEDESISGTSESDEDEEEEDEL